MASQLPPSCTYQHGMILKLHLAESNLSLGKSESRATAEANSTQASHGSHCFDAELDKKIIKSLSALMSESPGDHSTSDLNRTQLEHDSESTASKEPTINSRAGPFDNMDISSGQPFPMGRGLDPATTARLSLALSTLIAQPRNWEVPTSVSRLQSALLQHEHAPVAPPETASTQVVLHNKEPETATNAQVLTLFHPFTMSVTLKVLIDGHSEPAVLKLFDRRVASVLRVPDEISPWNEEREAKYHELVRSGEADKFIDVGITALWSGLESYGPGSDRKKLYGFTEA